MKIDKRANQTGKISTPAVCLLPPAEERKTRHFAEVDSTNAAALRWGREGAPHGAIVTADAQTAGRGRRGREWNSPPGKGVYLSVIVRPGTDVSFAPRLNFAACLGATHALHEVTGLIYHTKWPNDVLLHGRKVAGVLSEIEMQDGRLDFVVVGIGINVNFTADDLPPRALYPATSLLLETEREWPVWAVAQAWLHDFSVFYTHLAFDEWPLVRDEFWRRCAQRGKAVTVHEGNETISGKAIALSDDGALRVESARGVRSVVAGDVA